MWPRSYYLGQDFYFHLKLTTKCNIWFSLMGSRWTSSYIIFSGKFFSKLCFLGKNAISLINAILQKDTGGVEFRDIWTLFIYLRYFQCIYTTWMTTVKKVKLFFLLANHAYHHAGWTSIRKRIKSTLVMLIYVRLLCGLGSSAWRLSYICQLYRGMNPVIDIV